MSRISIKLVYSKIEDLDVEFMHSSQDGAICTFLGTTRDYFEFEGVRRKVLELAYEAYEPMAEKLMHEIALKAKEKYSGLNYIVIYHRLGVVPVKEAAVLVRCTSSHRRDALDAVSWIMDELKAKVPIWKKEVYEDGSMWKQNSECSCSRGR